MVTELPLVLVEIGYIAAAGAITQGARFVVSRICNMLREVARAQRSAAYVHELERRAKIGV